MRDHTSEYLKIRISQLREDRDKAADHHIKQWYNRMAQELDWALQEHTGVYSHDCFMEEDRNVTVKENRRA